MEEGIGTRRGRMLLGNLREERGLRGYSLRDLEAASGVSRSTISKLELGMRRAQRKTADRLARALGVTIEDLAGSGELGREAPTIAGPPPPRQEQRGERGNDDLVYLLFEVLRQRAEEEGRTEEEVLGSALLDYLGRGLTEA